MCGGGGLIFTTEIVITPHRQLHDARLYLGNGWFEAMTLNGVAPQPSTESAQGRWQVWDFGQLPAATAFHSGTASGVGAARVSPVSSPAN
jgi:hypothetical protein